MIPILKEIKKAEEFIQGFLEVSEETVLKMFAEMPGAQWGPSEKLENAKWIYVPGARKDRVLLVAHADTVNTEKCIPKVEWINGVGRLDLNASPKHVRALGGDDRLGCALLYAMHANDNAYGHSLLITTGEESGGSGARSVTANKGLCEDLSKHQFAVQIDRRGMRNYVFYSCSNDKFEKYVLASLPKWEKMHGSFSDIAHICPQIEICGVNMAAGYFNEHSQSELVVLPIWYDTYAALGKWLTTEALVRHPLPKPPPQRTWKKHTGSALDMISQALRGARWDEDNVGGSSHEHKFFYDARCSAHVCDGCGDHSRTTTEGGGSITRWFNWRECKNCLELAVVRQKEFERTMREVEQSYAWRAGKTTESDLMRVKNYLSYHGYMLTKKQRRRGRLFISDSQAESKHRERRGGAELRCRNCNELAGGTHQGNCKGTFKGTVLGVDCEWVTPGKKQAKCRCCKEPLGGNHKAICDTKYVMVLAADCDYPVPEVDKSRLSCRVCSAAYQTPHSKHCPLGQDHTEVWPEDTQRPQQAAEQVAKKVVVTSTEGDALSEASN